MSLNLFFVYLVDLKFRRKTKNKFRYNIQISTNTIPWIEKLLQTPIEDGRKYTIWKIVSLVNIRKLKDEESIKILTTWLEKCNKLRKLDFNPDREIKTKPS